MIPPHRSDHGTSALSRPKQLLLLHFIPRSAIIGGTAWKALFPIECANARIGVLDVLALGKRLIAEPQCLVRIAEKPKTPGGVSTNWPLPSRRRTH